MTQEDRPERRTLGTLGSDTPLRCGIFHFPTDHGADVRDIARLAEDLGLDLMLVPEHTHVSANRLALLPSGPDLPPEHLRTLDPFVVLGGLAATTERLLLGTAVCVVSQRDPLTLAKTTATLDLMSSGRFVFGVGFGSDREELENHGVAWETRRAHARESIRAIRAIWSEEVVDFSGSVVGFGPARAWPKPVPAPPVLLGGHAGDHVLRTVVEDADGWLPHALFVDLPPALDRMRRMAAERERDIEDLVLCLVGCPARRETVLGYRDLGVRAVAFHVPSEPWPEVRARLEHCGRIAAEVAA